MKTFFWEELRSENIHCEKHDLFSAGTAVTIGKFDGVHFGHRALFKEVLNAPGYLKKGVVSFVNPPKKNENDSKYAGNILTLRLKLKKIAEFGFDFITLIDFSSSFAKIEGHIFIEDLAKTVCMKYLVVGEDFSCGYRRGTGLPELRQLSERLGFGFDSIKRVCNSNYEVSSTEIRKAIYNSDFTLTEKLLGYPFLLDSYGLQWCETGKGFKTSLKSFTQIVPCCGRYDVNVLLTDNSVNKGFFTVMDTQVCLEFENSEFLQKKNVGSKEIDSIIFVDKE
ncbi:MAG: riboflavin biosynthesis protein [Treponema sp.]|nr:MAG: riboflavin biosynthesis protein [Treponema sp.]